jgi:hypothetical protein
MSIPLDRLYHYIESIAQEIYKDDVVIYRFWPHGSKNVNDLCKFNDFELVTKVSIPIIWCHDQEPLDHQSYQTQTRRQSRIAKKSEKRMKILGLYTPRINLNYVYNALFF